MCKHIWEIESEMPGQVLAIGICARCGKVRDFLTTKGVYMKILSPEYPEGRFCGNKDVIIHDSFQDDLNELL